MDPVQISRSAVLVDVGQGSRNRSIHLAGIIAAAILGLLLVACYVPVVWQTGRVILFGDDMAHGLFAPVIALFIVWEKRRFLLEPSSAPSAWSLVFFGFAAMIAAVSTLANSSTFSRFALLISLVGALLLNGGWTAVRQFIFPLALLLFTFPIPDVLYGDLTQPLQLLATRLSESAFEVLGFSVIREGNILQLSHMKLSVVEACSGLRSLITLFFFCLVYSYFFETRLWLRATIALAALPAAIGVNALRITATGILGKYNMEWTRGTWHETLGWFVFTLGFLVVFCLHRAIRRLILPARAVTA